MPVILARAVAAGSQVQEGLFEVVSETVPGASSYTLEVALDRSTYTHGNLMMFIPNIVGVSTSRKRLSASIAFAIDPNAAISIAGKAFYTSVGSSYYVRSWMQQGFRYDIDGQLSYVGFSSAAGQLMIEKVWIDGDKLKIVFTNTHGSVAATLNIRGRYHVEG